MLQLQYHKIPKLKRKKSINKTQFDNLATNPAVTNPGNLGTYESITYNAFSLINSSDSLVGSITPQSKPNLIVTSSEQQGLYGTPSLTVAEPYTSFGLTDFWFACAAHTSESIVDVPTQCTVTVAGFERSSDKEVAVASFTFTPPTVR